MSEKEKKTKKGLFGFLKKKSKSGGIETEVAKEKKLSTQQVKYYTEPDFYTKGTYTNVLPSALSSLRGTSAKMILRGLLYLGIPVQN